MHHSQNTIQRAPVIKASELMAMQLFSLVAICKRLILAVYTPYLVTQPYIKRGPRYVSNAKMQFRLV